MLIWAIIATIVSVIAVSIFISYRRQVKNTCRHLEFMKENRTNLRLRSGLPFKELYELSDRINEILDRSDEMRQKAERGEQNLKDAITNISHDIRTPLTSLDGFFQLMSVSESEEERAYYSKIIKNRIESLKYMLEELFTYTKLQNSDYKMATERLNFTECVLSAAIGFYGEFKERGIAVTTDFTEERIPVDCNLEAVQRIIRNILKNALDHGSTDAVIRLYRDGDRVIFYCENRTENAADIDASQVFSRFYKADPARTHSSAGLGLAIAKGLAERMGGGMSASIDGDRFKAEVWFYIQNP